MEQTIGGLLTEPGADMRSMSTVPFEYSGNSGYGCWHTQEEMAG